MTWADRFWSYARKGDDAECWPWTRGRFKNGYGKFNKPAVDGDPRRVAYAHRVAWELANGATVPVGLYVMHSCDNPPCVNPRHLSVGTPRDNIADMDRKNRRAVVVRQGELHNNHRLTNDIVVDIRLSRLLGQEPATIAARHGVSRTTVNAVCCGDAWGHIPESVAPLLERGLSSSGLSVLRLMYKALPTGRIPTQQDLANELGRNDGTVCTVMRTLCNKGYLMRGPRSNSQGAFLMTDKALRLMRWLDTPIACRKRDAQAEET